MNISSIYRLSADTVGAGHRSYVLRGGRLTQAQKRILQAGNSAYCLNIDTDDAVDWECIFPNTTPDARRIIEIGFGDGETLIKDALAETDARFIGIETYLPGIASALLSVNRLAMTNLRALRADAASLFPETWRENSLDEIRVFFPDPWPKKRHHKRRLLKKNFLSKLILCLRPAGKLHILTDWSDYAQQINRAFEDLAWDFDCHILGKEQTPVSKYGRTARAEGRDIIELCFIKPL